MTNGKPTLQLSTSIFFTTCFISTLHHVSSPAKRTCCQMPLFHQALPKSLFQFGKCPAKGRAQEAAMAHILTQNNKHNRDAQAPAGHKHFVHKNLLRTRPVEDKDTNKQSGARLGKKKKGPLTSRLYSSTVLLSGSTICQQMRMHKSISSIPPTIISNFWSLMIWKSEENEMLSLANNPHLQMLWRSGSSSRSTQHFSLTTVIT